MLKLNNSITKPLKNQLPNKIEILFNCLCKDSTRKGKETPTKDNNRNSKI